MALSSNQPFKFEIGTINDLPVAASTTIYQGGAVGINASGYAVPLTEGLEFAGHANSKADNSSGSNGDITVSLQQGVYRLEVTVTGVAITDNGKDVYATDDNTYTLTRNLTRVGEVVRYVGANTALVEFSTAKSVEDAQGLLAEVYEFDCETGVDTDLHTLIPAAQNKTGLLITDIYGVVTEVFAGSTQDQGIVTIADTESSPNSIATVTPSNAGGDAVDDIVVGYSIGAAATGQPTKTVAAGFGVTGQVTQVTSGGTPAGKMKIYIKAIPLA